MIFPFVIWPISTMLWFGWFPLDLLFPSRPVLVPILWWQYRAHQIQLLSPLHSCSMVFDQFSSKIYILITSFTYLHFIITVIHLAIFFLRQFLLIVFHWSLSDNKFCQVSSSLTNLNNTIVEMVSILLPISNLSIFLFKSLGTTKKQLQLVSPSPSCSVAFLVLWQGLSTCLSFRFLWFSLCGPLRQQSPLYC